MKSMKKYAVKNSKKAFTLVELVVVIAVLAIIAAIAIPMVIGIMASATDASGDEQARMLNEKCKVMYSEIRLGTINNTDSKNADGSAVTYAETKNANLSSKVSAADNATIANVKAYNGLKSINCDNFYYCTRSTTQNGNQYSKGEIYYTDDGNLPNNADFAKVNDTLALGYLY